MRYSSWQGVYAGHIRREIRRRERISPQRGITVRQYDSRERRPPRPRPPAGPDTPVPWAVILVVAALALAGLVLSQPAPPALDPTAPIHKEQ